MDIFSRTRMLYFIIFLLLIINIVTLYYVWINSHSSEKVKFAPDNYKTPIEFISKELNFKEQQVLKLKQNYTIYKFKSSELKEKIRVFHDEINDKVINEQDIIIINSDFDSLGKKKAELDKLTYKFFFDLNQICDSSQKLKLKTLLREIFQLVNKRSKK